MNLKYFKQGIDNKCTGFMYPVHPVFNFDKSEFCGAIKTNCIHVWTIHF
jgi:hypothetical protein